MLTESNATIEARLLVNALRPRYPLDVVWLAGEILGKPVELDQEYFPDNICALILDKPEYPSVHICTNLNRPYTSRRFSIVHELAHIYLGHTGDISFIESEEDPVLHTEADGFATETLTPKHRILTLAHKYREPLAMIHQVLRGYDVSLEMTCRRLVELGIYNGTFSCCNENETFFTYNSPGFAINIETIDLIPKIKRGCLVTRKETIRGMPVNCYFKRFQSGNFLIVFIEQETVTSFTERRSLSMKQA